MLVYRNKGYDDHFNPSNYPFLYYAWAASVLGPVLFLLAILHAALWRWPSSAVGSVVISNYTVLSYTIS